MICSPPLFLSRCRDNAEAVGFLSLAALSLFFWSQSFSLSFFLLWLVGIRGAVEKGTGGQDLGIDLGFGAAAHFLVSLFFFCFSSFSSELLPSLLQLYSFRF